MERSPQQKLHQKIYEETNRCIQCGYCLPACPTYLSFGRESASPRGRINLVKMAAEGKIDVVEDLAEPIDLCLGCRACEVACPVNISYGTILEAAKETIFAERQSPSQYSEKKTNAVVAEQQGEERASQVQAGFVGVGAEQQEQQVQQSVGKGSFVGGQRGKQRNTSVIGKVGIGLIRNWFPHPGRLRLAGNVMWLAQRLKLDAVARKSGLLDKIYAPLAHFSTVIPTLDAPWKRLSRGSVMRAAVTPPKQRIAFFTGCVMDAVMDKTNRQTVALLHSVGCEVVVPNAQSCCGALHSHQGMSEQAHELAKRNIAAFEAADADYYVNNAGGCGAMLHEYDKLFPVESEWHARAERFVAKVKDISEILWMNGPLPYRPDWRGTVTLQDSCHMRNVQKAADAPRKLIQSIPGATFVELENSEQCCGSGGVYNLVHYEESMIVLDGKMKKVEKTAAAKIVTTNPGCLLQMKLGVQRVGKIGTMEAVHIVELLAEACGIEA